MKVHSNKIHGVNLHEKRVHAQWLISTCYGFANPKTRWRQAQSPASEYKRTLRPKKKTPAPKERYLRPSKTRRRREEKREGRGWLHTFYSFLQSRIIEMICPTRSFQKINNNETSTDSMSPNQRAMVLLVFTPPHQLMVKKHAMGI